jgi:hypothetical protein
MYSYKGDLSSSSIEGRDPTMVIRAFLYSLGKWWASKSSPDPANTTKNYPMIPKLLGTIHM